MLAKTLYSIYVNAAGATRPVSGTAGAAGR